MLCRNIKKNSFFNRNFSVTFHAIKRINQILHIFEQERNTFSVVEGELADIIPVIHCSIAGTRIVGRITVGNRKGLLVPNDTTDQELQHLRNRLVLSENL